MACYDLYSAFNSNNTCCLSSSLLDCSRIIAFKGGCGLWLAMICVRHSILSVILTIPVIFQVDFVIVLFLYIAAFKGHVDVDNEAVLDALRTRIRSIDAHLKFVDTDTKATTAAAVGVASPFLAIDACAFLRTGNVARFQRCSRAMFTVECAS